MPLSSFEVYFILQSILRLRQPHTYPVGKSWELLRLKCTNVKTVARYRKVWGFVFWVFLTLHRKKFRLCSPGHVLARQVITGPGCPCSLWVNTLLTSGDPGFIEMFASFRLIFSSEIHTGPQQFKAIFQKKENFQKVCFVTSG